MFSSFIPIHKVPIAFKVAAKTDLKQSRGLTPNCLKTWGLSTCLVVQKPQKVASKRLRFLGDDPGEGFSDIIFLIVPHSQPKKQQQVTSPDLSIISLPSAL